MVAKHELPVQEGQSNFEVLELFDDHLLLKQPMSPFSIISVSKVLRTESDFDIAIAKYANNLST